MGAFVALQPMALPGSASEPPLMANVVSHLSGSHPKYIALRVKRMRIGKRLRRRSRLAQTMASLYLNLERNEEH